LQSARTALALSSEAKAGSVAGAQKTSKSDKAGEYLQIMLVFRP
jgi:hypothetical protein